MRLMTIIMLLMGIISCTESITEEQICVDTNCADYASQAEAQADFEANPGCRSDLDHDRDGKACEAYFKSQEGTGEGSGCPTTANCGCSNKKKAECASACCQWIVGEGCKCK